MLKANWLYLTGRFCFVVCYMHACYGEEIAYVLNRIGDTVSIVDEATDTVTGNVSDPGSYVHGPFAIGIAIDKQKAYVANLYGAVNIINTLTNTITENVSGSFSVPDSVAFSPNGVLAYIANQTSDSISIINVPNDTQTGSITGLSTPVSVVLLPGGTRAYVANYANNTVSIINVACATVEGTVNDAAGPFGTPVMLAISPDGSKVYVANQNDNTVSVIRTSDNTVTGFIDATEGIFYAPYAVAFSPDGTLAYVTNYGNNTVSIVDVTSDTVTGLVNGVFNSPTGAAFSSGGSKAYVANSNNNTLSIIDVASGTVTGLVHDPDNLIIYPEALTFFSLNTKPVANSTTAVVPENVALTIHLSGSDGDGDPLTFIKVTDPSHGTLGSIISTGDFTAKVTYTPINGYTGGDVFTFKVNDGIEDSDPATVSLTIRGVLNNEFTQQLVKKYYSKVATAPI